MADPGKRKPYVLGEHLLQQLRSAGLIELVNLGQEKP